MKEKIFSFFLFRPSSTPPDFGTLHFSERVRRLVKGCFVSSFGHLGLGCDSSVQVGLEGRPGET